MEIVDAHDMPTDENWRQVAKAEEPALDNARKLRLYPELRQSRLSEFGDNTDRNASQDTWWDWAGSQNGELDFAGQWMAFCDQCVERARHLKRVAGNTSGFESEKIAIYQPGVSPSHHRQLIAWREHLACCAQGMHSRFRMPKRTTNDGLTEVHHASNIDFHW